MIDIKLLRENPEFVKERLKTRDLSLAVLVDEVLDVDKERRLLIAEVEKLKAEKNKLSKEIGRLFKEGKKEEAEKLKQQVQAKNEKIEKLEKELKKIEEKFNKLLLSIPNLPHESVPIGEDESQNVEIRKWGEPRKFDLNLFLTGK